MCKLYKVSTGDSSSGSNATRTSAECIPLAVVHARMPDYKSSGLKTAMSGYKADNADQLIKDNFAVAFYHLCYLPYLTSNNHVLLAASRPFYLLFELTRLGTEHAHRIAASLKTNPFRHSEKLQLSETGGNFQWNQYKSDVPIWCERVLRCVFIPEIARVLVCPTAINCAFLKGRAHQLVCDAKANNNYNLFARNVANYRNASPNTTTVESIVTRKYYIGAANEVKLYTDLEKKQQDTTHGNIIIHNLLTQLKEKNVTISANTDDTATGFRLAGYALADSFEAIGNTYLKEWMQELMQRSNVEYRYNLDLIKTIAEKGGSLASATILGSALEQRQFVDKYYPSIDPFTGMNQAELKNLTAVYVECVEHGCMAVKSTGNHSKDVVVPNLKTTIALWDYRDTGHKHGVLSQNFLQADHKRKDETALFTVDISKFTDCLGIYRHMPSHIFSMKTRQMALLTQTYNRDSLSSLLLPGSLKNSSIFNIRPRYTVWVVLLEGSRITWIVDNKDKGKIYVMHPTWELSTKKGNGKNAKMQELCTIADLEYAMQRGYLPPRWCATNIIRDFQDSCREVYRAHAMDCTSVLGLAASMHMPARGVEPKPGFSLSLDPANLRTYLGIANNADRLQKFK